MLLEDFEGPFVDLFRLVVLKFPDPLFALQVFDVLLQAEDVLGTIIEPFEGGLQAIEASNYKFRLRLEAQSPQKARNKPRR